MAVAHLDDFTSVHHLRYCLSLVFIGAPTPPPTTTSSHVTECFHPVGIALMSCWDNCQHRCHLCPCDRHIWRGIPCMDSALSVNTTYLACIVVVLLFVILKFFCESKHVAPLPSSFCRISTSLWTLTLVSSQESLWSLADVSSCCGRLQ